MWQVLEHRQIAKICRSLPRAAVKKYELWKDIVFRHGPGKLREFPGFHDEKLKGVREGQRSSRLNLQYRVIYSVDRAILTVDVLEITPRDYTWGEIMKRLVKSEFLTAKRHAVLRTGEVIGMLRELKGWTQRELAERCGISVTNLSLLERGRIEIGKKRAERIAKAFAIHPAIIMFPEYEGKGLFQIA
jgi:mRNA-degrading endonuclease RelE of RelBE toxin-antitoxin system/DNA-binding XRE family transcriptional regulator